MMPPLALAIGRGEKEKKEIKTPKPMHVFGLLVFMF
jgi:hypothetical protein